LFNCIIDRDKISMLATCAFIRRKETVLLLGPPGTGKTHLAAALGVKAVQSGFSTIFIEADDLIEGMRRVRFLPRLTERSTPFAIAALGRRPERWAADSRRLAQRLRAAADVDTPAILRRAPAACARRRRCAQGAHLSPYALFRIGNWREKHSPCGAGCAR